MQPEEWKKLDAFRKLIQETIDGLGACSTQATLSRTADELAARWDTVDAKFAQVLRGVQSQAWSMQLPQIREVTRTVQGHLEEQLAQVEARLR